MRNRSMKKALAAVCVFSVAAAGCSDVRVNVMEGKRPGEALRVAVLSYRRRNDRYYIRVSDCIEAPSDYKNCKYRSSQ